MGYQPINQITYSINNYTYMIHTYVRAIANRYLTVESSFYLANRSKYEVIKPVHHLLLHAYNNQHVPAFLTRPFNEVWVW